MITHIKRGVMLAAVAVTLAASVVQGVGAQTTTSSAGVANGFRISPVRSELTINKGKTSKLTLTVENPTDVATTAQPIVNDFVASDDESGTPRLVLDDKAPTPKNSFKALVGDVADVPLGPREKKDVDLQISVPAGANSGGYYGAVRFVPTNTAQKGNVGLTASVGTIVLITVPGNLTEKASLVQMTAAQNSKPKSFLTSGDVSVITRIRNDGDIHLQPFGKVEVKNMFGKVVGSYEFNNTDPRANILPGSTRRFENSLPSNTKWFGRYTISANLGYSQGSGSIISATSSFWYMPGWSLIVLALLLLLLGGGAFVAAKRLRGSHAAHVRR